MSARLASKLASTSSFKYRLGAVIVKNGRVLSTGVNELRYTSAHIPKKHITSLHAEQAAIVRLLRHLDKLAGATLYVSRVDREGRSRMARPCKMCQDLITAVGIKKVFFTTENGVEQL